jgi:hypothetical protein
LHDNFIKKHPTIDNKIFQEVIKNLLDKISKDKVLSNLPNILENVIKKDANFFN